MKKYLLILLTAMIVMSCNQMTISRIEGTYSYKTSCVLTITDNDNNKTYDVGLDGIIGTLDVQRLPYGDSILLVFNELRGDLTTVRAEIKGDSILMPMYQTIYSITSDAGSSWFQLNKTSTADYIVSVSGYGIIMDNMIVFNQQIRSGKILDQSKSQSVKSNNLKTVAKKN